MQDYLEADIFESGQVVGDEATLKLHFGVVYANYLAEVKNMVANDEDLAKEELAEAQETAGFHEPHQRLALGGLFNHMLLWASLRRTDEEESQPFGKLAEAIEKHFTDFAGLQAAFKKTVVSRAPVSGWVWLGLAKTGELLITQTNNEDNPLMGGVAEPQCTPVVGIDLWEHAYFAAYQGNREQYVDDFFKMVNWTKVSTAFETHNLANQVAPLL